MQTLLKIPSSIFLRAVQDSLLLGVMYWAFRSLQCLYPKTPRDVEIAQLCSWVFWEVFVSVLWNVNQVLFYLYRLYILTRVRSQFTEDFYIHQIKDKRDQIKHLWNTASNMQSTNSGNSQISCWRNWSRRYLPVIFKLNTIIIFSSCWNSVCFNHWSTLMLEMLIMMVITVCAGIIIWICVRENQYNYLKQKWAWTVQ